MRSLNARWQLKLWFKEFLAENVPSLEMGTFNLAKPRAVGTESIIFL